MQKLNVKIDSQTPRDYAKIFGGPAVPNAQRRETKRLSRTTIIMGILGIILLAALATTGYFYYQYKKVTKTSASEQIKKYVEEIGQFMLLPQGEEPTMATVTNAEKLKNQSFFKSAQNGDVVLIYPQAQKAILYRPAENLIIEATSTSENTVNPDQAK